MGATLRKRVYAPYLRELKVLDRQTDIRDFEVLERQAILPDVKLDGGAPQIHRKESITSWIRNTLLLIAGSASISLCLLPRTGVVVLGRSTMARLRGQNACATPPSRRSPHERETDGQP